MKNKLIIAGAGTGKTSYLINEALKTAEKTLITTFTINCKNEILDKITKVNGYIPHNIVVQTWFSLLLQNGVKPYKRALSIDKVKGVKNFIGNCTCVELFSDTGIGITVGIADFYTVLVGFNAFKAVCVYGGIDRRTLFEVFVIRHCYHRLTILILSCFL